MVTVLELARHVRAALAVEVIDFNGSGVSCVYVCDLITSVADAHNVLEEPVHHKLLALWSTKKPAEGHDDEEHWLGWWPQSKAGQEARIAALDELIADLEVA